MRAFASLLDSLLFSPSRNAKLTLLRDYFQSAPDPDRGYALAALTGKLDIAAAKPAMIRGLIEERTDPALFGWSYDFVGDLAETVALIWPGGPDSSDCPALTLSELVEALAAAHRKSAPGLVAGWMDVLTADERYALMKLITGGLRVGVSARMAKIALARMGGRDPGEIEEIWHGLAPPYLDLFSWLEGSGRRPTPADGLGFRPAMLATPLEDGDADELDPQQYAAEWKWDGVRVQVASDGQGRVRLYSRTGDEIGAAFPDVTGGIRFAGVVDGELLVANEGRDGFADVGFFEPAPFNHLQQRLNRKTVSAKKMAEFPAFIRLYDMLFEGDDDIRSAPFEERRRRLERFVAAGAGPRVDLSPLVPFYSWSDLSALRKEARRNGIEGLMLKRWDSVYEAGRPRGPWFKWKRDPLTADAVLMYAQRGHGKRSSYYSDYTFGCWTETEDGALALAPVGKAYFGFTDEELRQLDKWVRDNTVRRYGPVREVRPELVLEVAFDSLHRSSRHKSGVAMRFPRISRIRWDKPFQEADKLRQLLRLIEE